MRCAFRAFSRRKTMDRKYQKSAVRIYNSSAQTVTDALTQLTLLGSTCTNTGCSLNVQSNSINVRNSGLYYISGDITFTPTAAGDLVFQLYNSSEALPCAIATFTTTADSIVTLHVETTLCLNSCCAVQPSLNLRVSGVAGDVNWLGMSVVRLA
jgi:hypothetical protein